MNEGAQSWVYLRKKAVRGCPRCAAGASSVALRRPACGWHATECSLNAKSSRLRAEICHGQSDLPFSGGELYLPRAGDASSSSFCQNPWRLTSKRRGSHTSSSAVARVGYGATGARDPEGPGKLSTSTSVDSERGPGLPRAAILLLSSDSRGSARRQHGLRDRQPAGLARGTARRRPPTSCCRCACRPSRLSSSGGTALLGAEPRRVVVLARRRRA